MAAGKVPHGEAYQESTDFSWTERAFVMLEGGELRAEAISSFGIIRSRVWGQCPRCGHLIDDQQTLTAVANLPGGWRGPSPGSPGTRADSTQPDYVEVDVSCDCRTSHSGAPADAAGCGVSFRVELPLRHSGRND